MKEGTSKLRYCSDHFNQRREELMKSVRGEFVRKLGCLRLELKRMNQSLRVNDFTGIESGLREIQVLLIDLAKHQRKLMHSEQMLLRPRFAALRNEALCSWEMAQRTLDDSLEAMLCLIKTVQDRAGYPVGRQHNPD